MSAWVCSAVHIGVLARAAVRRLSDYERKNPETGAIYGSREVAALLATANLVSVEARYGEEVLTTLPDAMLPEGKPAFLKASIDAASRASRWDDKSVVLIKAIHCLAYQSCEHPSWKVSEAKRLLDALEAELITTLPGYDKAPWGLDEEPEPVPA